MSKRLITILIGILVIIFSISALCSIFAWFTNLIFAIPQWGMIDLGSFGEWLKELHTLNIFQWLSSFYLITVDSSTVTTAVIMLTLIYASFGMKDIYLAKKRDKKTVELDKEYFPFWQTYQNLYVYMGLLGTLWAFIIAFNVTKATSNDPEKILEALGTALWSSFSAIILAFFVCPLVVNGFRCIINKIFQNKPSTDENDVILDINSTTKAFNNLSIELKNTENYFHRLNSEINYSELSKKMIEKLSFIEKELQSIKECNLKVLNEKNQVDSNFKVIENKISTVEKRFGVLEKDMKDAKNTKEIISKIRDYFDKLN